MNYKHNGPMNFKQRSKYARAQQQWIDLWGAVWLLTKEVQNARKQAWKRIPPCSYNQIQTKCAL